MTPKLTDEQIIKAYKICNVEGSCNNCPAKDTKYCDTLPKDIFDLINRLKAENKRLEYTLLGVMHFVDKWLDGEELEQDEVNRADTMREKTLRMIETAKTEAYKEFVERLKDEKYEVDVDAYSKGYLLGEEDIDNFLKEKVGEK